MVDMTLYSIPEENVKNYPVADITPKFKDCIVEVSAIGLRNLLPYRLLPITKPYLEVDTGGDTVMKTKICDIPSGTNPNLLQTLELDVRLPSSRLFAPPLNMRVYDDRGIYKALIATRSLSLAPFITWDDTPVETSMVHLEDDPKPIVVTTIPGANPDAKEPEVICACFYNYMQQKDQVVIPVPLEDDSQHTPVELLSAKELEMKNVAETVSRILCSISFA